MDQIPRISGTVYADMCTIVGTPTLTSIRRNVVSITETIQAPAHERLGYMAILSGSCREGLDQLASDLDFMDWPTNHHVIWDLNHADKYNTERCTLILMEYSWGHPGFALLQLLTPSNNVDVRQSYVRINDILYISSTKYREKTLFSFGRHSTQHGPCESGWHGPFQYDIAHCFACNLWPSIAFSFNMRCQSKCWPSENVLKEIIHSGCHVVPIGFPGSPEEDNEWRISFSLAEQKLVYSMNHTQFMCYGLLKLALKEILLVKGTNGQPILCSYFMKTVLFWIIQNNTVIDWNPASLLSGFWMCFKFLMVCVYHGNLPNFFIPENNIFISKVFGHSQQLLFERLFELYNFGIIACLLRCGSIRDCLMQAICNRQYVLSTAESEANIDNVLFNEIVKHTISGTPCLNAGHCFTNLQFAVRCLYAQNLSSVERVTIRKCISSILRCNVHHLYHTPNSSYNKGRLRRMYACLNLLKVSAKMGFLSDRIYLIFFLYATGKNNDAIKYSTEIKTILKQPYVMYAHLKTPNHQMYIDKVGGLSLSEKMKRAVTMNIKLPRFMVKELELEFRVIGSYIFVPPLVIILMLLVLCYRGKPQEQEEALKELYFLLRNNERHFLNELSQDISWEILGICQQICGYHQEAILSYQTSRKQTQHHHVEMATYCRERHARNRILLPRTNK